MIREEIELNLITYRQILSELIVELKDYKKKNKEQNKLIIQAEKTGLEIQSQKDYKSQIQLIETDIQLLKKLIRRYENVLSK